MDPRRPTIENYREVLAQDTCPSCGGSGAFFEPFVVGPHVGLKCRCGLDHPLRVTRNIMWLVQNDQRRQKSPESTDATWTRCGNYCWGCGVERDDLAQWGIGTHQHHTRPYADASHEAALIPLCADCHEHITAVQRAHRKRLTKRAVA